jgi:hypothetical protein
MKASEAPSGGECRPQFPSPEWSMTIECTPGPEGPIGWHANIFRSTAFVCRVALSGNFKSEAEVQAALVRRVREWLKEYEGRTSTQGSGGLHIVSNR